MTPAGGGRHCASCEKVVTDFTRMTDGEMVAFFQERAGQRVCGRLRPDQLTRPIREMATRNRLAPTWVLVAATVLTACSPDPAAPKQAAPATHEAKRWVVRGQVVNADNEPVWALVGLSGDTTHTATDSAGYFRLILSRPTAGQQVLAMHYGSPHVMTCAPAQDKVKLKLPAFEEVHVLGEVDIDSLSNPKGCSWPVSYRQILRWMRPVVVSTVKFVPTGFVSPDDSQTK